MRCKNSLKSWNNIFQIQFRNKAKTTTNVILLSISKSANRAAQFFSDAQVNNLGQNLNFLNQNTKTTISNGHIDLF